MARSRQYETDQQNERSQWNDDPQSRRQEGGQHSQYNQQAGRSGQQGGYGNQGGSGAQRGYGGQRGSGGGQSPYGQANEDFGRGMGDDDFSQSRPLREDFDQDYGRGYGQGGRGPGDSQGYSRSGQGYVGPGYGGQDYGHRGSGYGDQRRGGQSEDRGFLERAGDEISSWFGDEDAQRRRENDHRGKGPKGYTRSDDRIREDVNDHLSEDYAVDASDIEVSVSEGEVTLSGTVTSRQSKRRAEDCVERVSGVKHVQNNLRVKTPGIGGSGVGEGLSSDSRTGSLTGKASGQGNTQA